MKKTLAFLLAATMFLGGCALTKKDEATDKPESVTEKISVIITGLENEKLLEKTVDIEGEATAFAALEAAAPGKFKTSGGAMPYVNEILGLRAGAHGAMSGWTYEVNDETPMVGADKYILKSGDKVEWVYFAE